MCIYPAQASRAGSFPATVESAGPARPPRPPRGAEYTQNTSSYIILYITSYDIMYNCNIAV